MKLFKENVALGTKVFGAIMLFCLATSVSFAQETKAENLLKTWTGRKVGPAEEIRIKNSVGQKIELNQKEPAPIFFSAESKAEDAVGKDSAYYSIYINIIYMDGTKKSGVNSKFKSGTHDWEKASGSFTPPKPIKSLSYHLLFRNRPGKAWFRNATLSVGKEVAEAKK